MRLFIPLAICVLFAACGGSASPAEDEYRIQMRTYLAQIDSVAFCKSLDGLSNREVADILLSVNAQEGDTEKPGITSDDEERAGEIVKEECDRIN